MLDENRLVPVGACYQAGLMFSQGKTKEVMEEFSINLEICKSLSIPVLIVPSDSVSSVEEAHYQQAADSLVEASAIADKYGVNLAIEFLAKSRFLGSLSTAILLARKVSRENVGILFDTFHFYCGISKIEDIDLSRGDEIFLVHLNDVAEKPREILTDKFRVLPGRGIIPLKTIIKKLQKIGYNGYYSLELFNEELWNKDPFLAAKECFESLEEFRRDL